MARSLAYANALTLLSGAGTWHEARRSFQERRLDDALSPGEMHELLEAWLRRQAQALDDWSLSQELLFWADGGDYVTHLAGWQAVPPALLVEEASRRGWFVRKLPGGVLIGPPEGKPLRLPSGPQGIRVPGF